MLPVSQSQSPGTGSTVERVPDLGLLAAGAGLDGEQTSGGALEVQDGALDCMDTMLGNMCRVRGGGRERQRGRTSVSEDRKSGV